MKLIPMGKILLIVQTLLLTFGACSFASANDLQNIPNSKDWSSLTPDKRQEMSLKLLDRGELLVKARKFDTASKVMAPACKRPSEVPFPLTLGARMADIADLLMQLHEAKRADYYLDSAEAFLKKHEGESSEKKSLQTRIERLQKINSKLGKKEFVPGYTFYQVDPPKNFDIGRFLVAGKTFTHLGTAYPENLLSLKSNAHTEAILKDGASFKPAKKCPAGATTLDDTKNSLELDPGDYRACSLCLQTLKITKPGTVRIFLSGAGLEKGPVFLAKQKSDINSRVINTLGEGPYYKLELWYDGNGIIKVDENSKMSAVIYAPSARIEICKNAEFGGMLVGRDIFMDENVSSSWGLDQDCIEP